MIKKLRWKFIRITMMSVFAVLLLIVAAVNAVNVYQNQQAADAVTEMLLANNGTFHRLIPGFDKGGMLPGGDRDGPGGRDFYRDRFHDRAELPFATRYFTITLDADGRVAACDLESIASVTADQVDAIAERVAGEGRTVGWYQNYRYRVAPIQSGSLIIAMEASAARNSILSVFVITLAVGLAAFLIVFALVALFSRRAIQPISETYEKQRQFITDASHELKTPLTVIAANAEVLGMTYGKNEWTDGILRQSEHMRSLIGRMIQMSKLDEGEQTLVLEDFDLSDAVYDTAMSFSGLAASRGLHLTVDAVPQVSCHGDEAALRQVVSILVDNAVKYCDPGGDIAVSLSGSPRGLGREKLTITVRNTCAAAGSLDTDRLFERFYRGDKAHTSNSSYGLGLPIARSIVELHGGRIDAAAVPTGIITFTVTLYKAK